MFIIFILDGLKINNEERLRYQLMQCIVEGVSPPQRSDPIRAPLFCTLV